MIVEIPVTSLYKSIQTFDSVLKEALNWLYISNELHVGLSACFQLFTVMMNNSLAAV